MEVDNKIPDSSSLVTTSVLNTKIGEAEYITTQEFSKLTAEYFAAKLKQAKKK